MASSTRWGSSKNCGPNASTSGGASSKAYFRVDELLSKLANPNLHDIPRNLLFRAEMWDHAGPAHAWG